MQVFRKVIVLTTKSRFDVKGTVCVSARLATKDKNLGKPAVDLLQRKRPGRKNKREICFEMAKNTQYP